MCSKGNLWVSPVSVVTHPHSEVASPQFFGGSGGTEEAPEDTPTERTDTVVTEWGGLDAPSGRNRVEDEPSKLTEPALTLPHSL